MNEQWSQMNKTMQLQLKKKETFAGGIDTLLHLRGSLMEQMLSFREIPGDNSFAAMPCPKAKGYHSKTIAYSLFHVFRIEDIVSNALIRKQDEVFLAGDYAKRMNASIVTTGNEIEGEEIAVFSQALDIDVLYEYIAEVDAQTTQLLKTLSHSDLKIKMTEADKERLLASGSVGRQETACWLIDYWCSKDIKGLVQMPFSRHWIMHTEAAMRIRDKIIGR